MKSKEESVLELFYGSSRHWHFNEIMKKAGISRPRLAQWLNKFERESIIKRVKPKGKMPYYVQDFDSPEFHQRKRLFTLKRLAESGLLKHLASLKEAKVVILFGSFSRSDWYDDSDIDVFIYGDDSEFEAGKFSVKLKRDIQVHSAKDRRDLKRIDKMIPYILMGDFIKGSIEDLGVEIHAQA
ncbi:nucleotidyltransferase domain-containing protein [Candidatus Woesearchaeota archaeon]|nr:nucleotidyltransferase domain-containing protein [Candidatus Woesearchaeota archaeon]